MEGLKIKTNFYTDNDNIIIIELSGYIDQTNTRQVEKVINDILRSGKRQIVFDLSDLIYMSSAGWGIFVGEIKTVRDKGGDIKLATMSPEVYEVFQMLEFYHIIQDFPTVAEAVESFPTISEKKISTHSHASPVEESDFSDLLEKTGVRAAATDSDKIKIDKPKMELSFQKSYGQIEKINAPKPKREREIDISQLPLGEKIKKIVAGYPLLNLFQIRKMLNHEKFGYTNISLLKLYNTLKFLDLNTKAKRYRFYRSV